MFKFITILCVLLIPIAAFLFGERCSGNFFPQTDVYVESDDAAFEQARELAASGRDSEAISAFREIIRRHPDSTAESNFEIAILSYNRGDYLQAIYHLNQFLSLRPEASKQVRDRVNGLLNSSEKLFLQKMLPGRNAEPADSGISTVIEEKYRAVMRENEVLKREVAELKAKLANGVPASNAGSGLPAVAVPSEEPVAVTPVPETPAEPEPPKIVVPATHTVVAGDTLSGISKKYYGTSARWKDIYNANRVTMSSPSALRIGMVLKLPRP